jgi:anti-anti-sigma regulatory factor
MFIIPLGSSATAREASGLLDRARVAIAVGTDVVVNCRGTERCDATALQVLLALRADLTAIGRRLHIVETPLPLRWRFECVGLDIETCVPFASTPS